MISIMVLTNGLSFAQINPLRPYQEVACSSQNVGTTSTAITRSTYGYVSIYPTNGDIRVSATGCIPDSNNPIVYSGGYIRTGYKKVLDPINVISASGGTVNVFIVVERYGTGQQ